MGYPVCFSNPDRAALVRALQAYVKCMRAHGKRVSQFPVIMLPDGTYSVTVDVCGSYDKSLDALCAKFPGMTHTHVDLREFSPGKKVVTKGGRK